MRAYDYLLQYQQQNRRIQNRLEQIDELKAMAESCTAPIEGERVQSSSVSRKIENAVCNYVNLEERLQQEIAEAQQIKKEVMDTIELLPPNEYDVLNMIYIKGVRFKNVAFEIGRSDSWVTYTHRKAMNCLQHILNERAKNDSPADT